MIGFPSILQKVISVIRVSNFPLASEWYDPFCLIFRFFCCFKNYKKQSYGTRQKFSQTSILLAQHIHPLLLRDAKKIVSQ